MLLRKGWKMDKSKWEDQVRIINLARTQGSFSPSPWEEKFLDGVNISLMHRDLSFKESSKLREIYSKVN